MNRRDPTSPKRPRGNEGSADGGDQTPEGPDPSADRFQADFWDQKAKRRGYSSADELLNGSPEEQDEGCAREGAPLSSTYAELSSDSSHADTGEGTKDPGPDPTEDALDRLEDWDDRKATSELIELYEHADMDRARLEEIKTSGETWGFWGCEDRCPESRQARPKASGDGKADPLQAAKNARTNRARPQIELFDQLAATAREAGVPQGLGFLDVEFTVPDEYHDEIGYDDRTPFLRACNQTLQRFWTEVLDMPGELAPTIQFHRASSTLPHQWSPHAHALVPAMARVETSQRPRSPHRAASSPNGAGDSGVWYIYARGARGKQPSELFVSRADLDELNRIWGEELEQELGLEPKLLAAKAPDREEPVRGLNTNYEFLHYDKQESTSDGGTFSLKYRLVKKVVYDTRDPLEDLNHRLQRIDGDTAIFQDKTGQQLVCDLEAVVSGIKRNFLHRPSHWRQGASYGWLADCNRRRTAQELELEDETKSEMKDRLAEEANTCPCCGEELVCWGQGTKAEAAAWIQSGMVPETATVNPDRHPDRGRPPDWSYRANPEHTDH